MYAVTSLADLVELIGADKEMFVRWAPEPEHGVGRSKDELTGVKLPGLSVTSLQPESWWENQPLELWAARRLYDYCHLRHERPEDTRPWIMTGRIVGRGPDNEPLLADPVPVARVDHHVLDEARELLEKCSRDNARWGPMRRPPDIGPDQRRG